MTDTTTVALRDLQPHPRNYNRHSADQVRRLALSLKRFGQVRSIVVWRNLILAGHGLAEAARSLQWETIRADVLPDDYPEELAIAYVVADNELARHSDPDLDALLALLDDIAANDVSLIEAIGFDLPELPTDGPDLEPDAPPELPLRTPVEYVPDAIWPSDNEWDIPLLDVTRQAQALELPLKRWGAITRGAQMRGTYHFYTEDYKFNALWADPSILVSSACYAFVEPNYSTNENMPAAVAIWGVFRKRWIARYAQSQGLRVWVDLNVSAKFRDLNMLGVPKGWNAYATRAVKAHGLDELEADYQVARAHSEGEPLFWVYGGPRDVGDYCKTRGWLWTPEEAHVRRGMYQYDGGEHGTE